MSPVSDSDRTQPADRPADRPATGAPALRPGPTTELTTELRRLFAGTAPADPEPERVSRWKATLDRLPPPESSATGPSAAGTRTRTARAPGTRPGPRTALPRTALLAAALVAVALLGYPADSRSPGSGTGTGTGALPGPPGAPLLLTRAQLPTAAVTGHDLGALRDPVTRASCLARVGEHGEPLGGRPVILDGTPGILLALPTGRVGRIRLLVVDPGCGPGRATVLADQTVGR